MNGKNIGRIFLAISTLAIIACIVLTGCIEGNDTIPTWCYAGLVLLVLFSVAIGIFVYMLKQRENEIRKNLYLAKKQQNYALWKKWHAEAIAFARFKKELGEYIEL